MCHFLEKFESERNILFSVILDHTLNVNHLSNVILGLVPRIHAKHLLNVIFGFIPRIHSEHLSSVILGFIPRIHIKHSSLDTRVTPEYDGKRSLIKGLNVVRQCAALLERRVQSSTRVRKAQAVTRQTNPIGRSMIEMLGVLAIIGVLSVGGIQGFSKAMETYQSHKQLEQINSLIYAALELRDGLIQNYKNAPTTQRYNLMPALSALGYLPDMKLVSNHATDKYGNSFNLSFGVDGCQQPDGTVAYTCFSYIGSDEEKKALYKYLKSASTGGEYAEMASKILDGWTFEGERIPNHKIEFSAQESEQSNCAISITLPQGWKFQEKTKKSDTEHEPLMLAGLNPLYTVYDIYDSDHTLIGAIGYSNYEPYEGDKDSVQVVYSALRLGSVYRFDTDSRYDVVKTNKYGTTALTTVVYQDGANAEPVNNWGILSYNNEKECFVAVELESNSVSESQVLEIAKSIEF